MDIVDKKILNILQEGIPMEKCPFKAMACKLGIHEKEVISRIQTLKNKRYIRRIGGVFDSRSLGYVSTLCAMRVNEKEIEKTAELINSYSEITHNYIRDYYYNIWFTAAAPSEKALNKLLYDIKIKTGVEEIMSLPSVRFFKTKVLLDMGSEMNDKLS